MSVESQLVRLFGDPAPSLHTRLAVLHTVLQEEGLDEYFNLTSRLLNEDNDAGFVDLAYQASYSSGVGLLEKQLALLLPNPKLTSLIIENMYLPNKRVLDKYNNINILETDHIWDYNITSTHMRNPEHELPSDVSLDDVQYANKEAEDAWAVTKRVEQIISQMSEEKIEVNFEPITFDPTHLNVGFHAILTAGTVIISEEEGIYVIPERTRHILNELGIPYHMQS